MSENDIPDGGTITVAIPKTVCKMCYDVGGYTCAPHKCINRVFEQILAQPIEDNAPSEDVIYKGA